MTVYTTIVSPPGFGLKLMKVLFHYGGSPMAMLKILEFPDPRLRLQAKPVLECDRGIRRLVDDMFETMYAAPGIGLAANQVNVQKRVIVLDVSEQKDQPLCLINPELLGRAGEEEGDEGCLSVPGVFEKIVRANAVRIRALNPEGKPFELEADGLLAVCIQHEMDHLKGKLFVDYLSSLKRERIRKKMLKPHTPAKSSASAARERVAI